MEGHVTVSSSAGTSTGGTSTTGSSVTPATTSSSSTEAIIQQRLIKCGVPSEYVERGQEGIADYVRSHRNQVPEVISGLFPGPEDLQASSASGAEEAHGPGSQKEFLNQCRDAIKWVTWAMFQGEPQAALDGAGQGSGGTRGVCGAVWGVNDIAYRCRTCEHDPTCAICVPCFQLGNHSTHDYCMIRTGGGCCDCGDITAWKQSGFCSKHCGFGQAAPLSSSIIESATPVLEALLLHWVQRLKAADTVSEGKSKKWSLLTVEEKVASQLSVVCVELLLEFCSSGETMLAFTAGLMGNNESGILETLMNTECFLPKAVSTSLHELLYKLLGDSSFKLSFAQTFISQYPKFLQDSVVEESATTGSTLMSKYREQAILNSFSVQLFTVPALTPKLVMESGLLDMLLEALKEFFRACAGEDGRLSVSKGPVVKRLYFRVLEDIRYVMSHRQVAKYIAEKRPDLQRAWLYLLAFVQGIYPQRRITSIHVEEENEDWGAAYFLENQMATIHPLFVAGAAAACSRHSSFGQSSLSKSSESCESGSRILNSADSVSRPVKVGCVLREPNVSNDGTSESDVEMRDITVTVVATENTYSETPPIAIETEDVKELSDARMIMPASLASLISECTQVLDTWLALDAARELAKSGETGQGGLELGPRRSIQWRYRGGRFNQLIIPQIEDVAIPPVPVITTVEEEVPPPAQGGTIRDWLRRGRRFHVLEPRVISEADPEDAIDSTANTGIPSVEMNVDESRVSGDAAETVIDIDDVGPVTDDRDIQWWMGSEAVSPSLTAGCEDDEWAVVDFDVSRQEVSFHLPLHRMLGLLLHKALDLHAVNSEVSVRTADTSADIHTPGEKFLAQMFRPGLQVAGFISVLMEHPLRLQVLCAQVLAGMWRRNGHSTSGLCDLYHTVHWCEDSLELDLFLLQCCAVMAPPEEFVERLQARFSLSDFFTLVLWRPNEYEVALALELLVLIIRLVSERGFCGLTEVEALRRELVQRLAVGDATHSALLKALPPRLQESKHVQDCLNAVASYRNPSGMQQGKYVLRDDCWCELDLYHPRWIPRELQLAEDRYLRACKASAVFAQLPRWKQPFEQLENLGRIVITSRVLDMLRSVFFHAAFAENPSESRSPEGLLFSALHLLALALDVSFAYQSKMAAKDAASSANGSSTPSGQNYEMSSPLLVGAVERVKVGRADGSMMEEPQSMLSILVTLCRKNSTGDPMATSDIGNYSVGGLIKILLRRFGELSQKCMVEIQSLAPEIFQLSPTPGATFWIGASGNNYLNDNTLVPELDRSRSMARERQAAAMAKMKAAQERFAVNYHSAEEGSGQEQGEEADAKRARDSEGGFDDLSKESQVHCALCRDSASASPLCFLIFVQKSKLLAISERTLPSWERHTVTVRSQVEKEGETPGGPSSVSTGVGDGTTRDLQNTAELWHWIQEALGDAQTRRARLLEGEDLLELLRNGLPPGIRNAVRVPATDTIDLTAAPHPDAESEDAESGCEITEAEVIGEAGTSDSPGALPFNWWEDNHGGAENDDISTNRDLAAATVLAEYVAAVSRPQEMVRRRGADSPRHVDPEQGRESNPTRARRAAARSAPPIAEATLYNSIGMSDTVGIYLSGCGHAVHQDCRDRYFSSLLQRYYSRALFEGVQIVDPDLGEFLCPACRRLANSVLPVLPGHTGLNCPLKTTSIPQLDLLGTSGSPAALQLEHAMRLLVKAEELVSKSGFRQVVDPQLPDTVKGVLKDLAKRLCGLFYPEKDPSTSMIHGRVHQGLLLWDVFRYSLMSAELAARSHKFTENIDDDLVALVNVGDATHGSVLPLLLRAAKATQSQSRQAVLLRARGMQLLLDSIANGISRDLFAEKALHDGAGGAGNFSSLLQYLDKGHDAADVQFWKRMADPVLVHDSFSSFLWLLFCLPLPFPANGAPFTALVHLFYLVTVIQVIAQAGAFLALDAELTPSTISFIASMHASLVGTCLQPLSDEENAAISAVPPLVVIRRLTLPFLRRCYLLQHLMAGSGQGLPVARAHQWELPQCHRVPTGSSSSSSGPEDIEQQMLQELEELDQLESIFCIPPLTRILEEDTVQNLVLSWCRHVKNDTGVRYFRQGPRLMGAAPFRMMQLPRLFQDLLQRYVKERCPRCNTVPDRPALCLLCGALCCAVSQRSCCSINRQGECYRHAMVCGAGIGVFLMLRRTNILLQRCERQAMWPSPYLDAFGEEDIELRRGKPLYLSHERYSALTAMVAAHGLDYSSPVLSHTTRDTPY